MHKHVSNKILERSVKHMKISREKINIELARKEMNVILNSQVVTPVCAGRVASALGVDVTEIME